MNNPKIIAMYLPQYHSIPENDEFWGKGFTDWVSVKKAKPIFNGHNQPRVPLNNNYYDLSEKQNVAWQAKLAKDHGVYGFGVYHYWFNNEKNLLTKPAEIIRDNKDIDINYFLAWDNCSWVRSWSNVAGNDWSPLADKEQKRKGPQVLIPYILGHEEDWENHYNAVRSHFKDERYIKVDNCPIFFILCYSSEIEKMVSYWDKLAKNDGFNGVKIIYRNIIFKNIPARFTKFNYEPAFSGWVKNDIKSRIQNKLKLLLRIPRKLQIYDYDIVWQSIIKNAQKQERQPIYSGCFVRYDDSPRRGDKAIIIKGESPEKFKKYLKQLIDICKNNGKEFIFVTAWNEWGEGAYLEPDTKDGYAYLEALKEVVTSI